LGFRHLCTEILASKNMSLFVKMHLVWCLGFRLSVW
jgi:hypothetical protein